MGCTMAVGKSIQLILVILSSTSVISHSRVAQATGRRLFGGYRIVPKVCQPTLPSRVKTNEPAICMFNYECSRRNGQVVGACMDGFLFGACCQLPTKSSGLGNFEKIPTADEIFNMHEIDHVPDIPILLNSDGTPLGITVPHVNAVKTETSVSSNRPNHHDTLYTKISTFDAPSTTIRPAPSIAHVMDSVQNAEKPQLPVQPDISHLEEDFPALLGQQNVLDDLSLPGLLSHSDANNDIQNHQDNSAVNPVTTLLRPDQILQIADPVDQLPALFSQGLGQSDHGSVDTILLNENGTALNETHNPDDLFRPSVESSTERKRVTETTTTTRRPKPTERVTTFVGIKKKPTTVYQTASTTQWIKFPEQSGSSMTDAMSSSYDEEKFGTSSMTRSPDVTQTYTNAQRLTTVSPVSVNAVDNFEKIVTIEERVSTKNVQALGSFEEKKTTTPMTTLTEKNDDLVRVPTITYDTPSGIKKDDAVDKEELAINHIISILNDTKPGSGTTIQSPNSSIDKWVSIDETSKPSLVRISTTKQPLPSPTTAQSFPYVFYKPAQTSNYYTYETVPTETTYSSYATSNPHSSRPSTQSSFASTSSYGYSSKTTTNPPAPTLIVLGPLGTEFTIETTQKTVTRKPTSEPARPTTAIVRPTVPIGSIRPSPLTTRKPSVSTTITHNISTVISNVATNNVVSTSFFSVNLKDGTTSKPTVSNNYSTEAIVAEDNFEQNYEKATTRRPTIWTTLAPWSDKPSFYLKPSTPSFVFPDENLTPVNTIVVDKDTSVSTTNDLKSTTPVPHCEDDTPAPDDLINFPPVRNPNLNISAPISQQEKPTIVETFNNTGYPDIEIMGENDIPMPTFIEDDVLTNKVDTFVNKIVQSLQGNFQELKDIVYNRANATSTTPSTVTKRPVTTTKKPVRKPATTSKPSYSTTRRPATTKRPTNRPTSSKPSVTDKPARPSKPTTLKPKPTAASGVTTKKPQVTTKRTRPTRRPTTTPATSTEAIVLEDEEETSPSTTVEITTSTQTPSPSDLRSQCGVRPLVREGKIVGGKAAAFGKWPWQVLIREATWLGLFTKNKCGGVLITEKYVVTAAHCQPGFLATLVAVFGEFDLSGELEAKRSLTRNVRRVIVNRGYDPATFENDLALLELESPVQFDEHIVPICMPEDGIDYTGRMATVTGWGRLKYNGGVPSTLQEVQVPIIKNSVCQEMFQTGGHSKLILDSFLCAGYANGQKDSCEGDSGGPLVMQRPDGRWFLVGTVSHGIKCAAPYLPGVYMRTTFFKPWLQGVTGLRGAGN
ncbi:transmembrane serine protease filzig [Ptiloglossa arizonensis]|uniref:transmembrane serine protease filzig n=1 Tax=Ptiloglossa arizonensis TaxID=3350558 RepID=UPI003FA079C7